MHVMIIGAAGMVGHKLTERLLADGQLGGAPLRALTLVDWVAPTAPAGFDGAVETIAADIATPGLAERLTEARADVIFVLAAIVSGEAEADFDKGYATNLDSTRALFDAIRLVPGYTPRVVFTSSIAVFGVPLPDKISDTHHLTPLTSYGTQKAIAELLLSDYSRRGFLDGIAIRLPTIVVRPGKANLAASSFFSGIIREPLNGQRAVLPVDESVRHWFASPRAAVGFLIHAATLDLTRMGDNRALSMPGLSATVAEQIAALGRIAGPEAVALIDKVPDPVVAKIVLGWPCDFDTARADALGFKAETSFDQIIQAYIEDDLS
ncbi:D-erythronate dehydrogenase [Flavimaricola marinus]|uniref:UDP-glucose 4-epimerase n=1 Tax=Flavimaricola marinus TaxID=1819565 RepID=A0A238LAF0_9RHOB|nr:D-erythronate dehydrogenase [Flavimaricola marinus]SMY06659.1 UDP-glucose 4-epimerase [Flavimaricola marinus]